MSGGSFDYLCFSDTPADAAQKGDNLKRMAEALEEIAPEHPVTVYTKRLAEISSDDIPEVVKEVWMAVEWNRSGDWGADQLDAALEAARTWRPYTGDPLHEGRDVASAYRTGLEDGKRNAGTSLVDFIRQHRDWGYETFGPNYSGTLPHLKKEIVEVEEDQDDLEEWVDVILLGISGAARSGGGRTAEEIVEALTAKYAKNQARTWPDWREAVAGEAIEHDRSMDQPEPGTVSTCETCGKTIVFSTFLGMGLWEPDVDPGNDPLIWRHQNGYRACSTAMSGYAAPA